MLKDKTVAAIVAAINMYLQEEQGGGEVLSTASLRPVPRAPVVNLWGIAGRDDAMKLRNLWQLGVWKK